MFLALLLVLLVFGCSPNNFILDFAENFVEVILNYSSNELPQRVDSGSWQVKNEGQLSRQQPLFELQGTSVFGHNRTFMGSVMIFR